MGLISSCFYVSNFRLPPLFSGIFLEKSTYLTIGVSVPLGPLTSSSSMSSGFQVCFLRQAFLPLLLHIQRKASWLPVLARQQVLQVSFGIFEKENVLLVQYASFFDPLLLLGDVIIMAPSILYANEHYSHILYWLTLQFFLRTFRR